MADTYKAVVIGASAGAVETLSALLRTLPADYTLPIIIVVHLPADKKSVLADVLQGKCAIQVREAEDKEILQPGTVYLAPPDYHLLAEADGSLSLSTEEPVLYSRPSIDVLFETAADAYGPELIGIILTGANSDGAAGLHAIMNAGGVGLVQNPKEAYAPTMPQTALDTCIGVQSLSIYEISLYLQKAAQRT